VIFKVKCLNKVSVNDACLNTVFKSLYHKLCKFQKVSGCWSTFHKLVLTRRYNWQSCSKWKVIIFLKRFGMADSLEIPVYLLAYTLLPFLWRGISNDSFHISENCEYSKDKVNHLRRHQSSAPYLRTLLGVPSGPGE